VVHCIFKKKATGKLTRPKDLVGGIDFATCGIGKKIDKTQKKFRLKTD